VDFQNQVDAVVVSYAPAMGVLIFFVLCYFSNVNDRFGVNVNEMLQAVAMFKDGDTKIEIQRLQRMNGRHGVF
jgi:hypothetical protein